MRQPTVLGLFKGGLGLLFLAATLFCPSLLPKTATSSPPASEGSPQDRRQRSKIGGSSPYVTAEIEDATRRGLQYLANNQSRAGYWLADVGFKINSNYQVERPSKAHVGITALAVMAFLANGELPNRGRHGQTVRRAVNYLVRASNEDGYLSANGTRMYSHAFATLALAEVYGMTRTQRVRDALQRSIDLISQCQNREGGWRYKPFAPESDMSITVCQVMALRAARNSGIFVQRNVIEDAVRYVKNSERPRGRHFDARGGWGRMGNGVFKYQQSGLSRASFALTAAGVTTLYGAGIYDHPLIDRGLSYMLDRFDSYNHQWAEHYFFYYGNYYAVQAFYMAGGHYWTKYYSKTSRFLLDRMHENVNEVYWECSTGPGRNFATAVAVLILAIPFQYLPIFQR